jgi:beta-lactamase regulating signal transducer with metallopeptidase domain/biopolymer transport protein ExbD/flagellar hook assembly protein FlgD
MKLMEALFSRPLMETLGWTLMHFVWQGALAALLLGAALFLLRRGDPRMRYAVLCAGMLALVVAPIVTGVAIHSPSGPALPMISETAAPEAAPVVEETVIPAVPIPVWSGWMRVIEEFLPQLLLVWFGGVCLLSARLMAGWLYLLRLNERANQLGQMWQETGERLSVRLDLGRRVSLLESNWIEVPMVVGWLRPAVLMPVGALAGLTPGQVEAILLHELAHIRRYDYLVNAIQAVVETLFFYHPAVWWISHRMRVEREYCCDDQAVRVGGNAVGYARALARLEELRGVEGTLVLAASGGALLRRIQRLVMPGMQDSLGVGGLGVSAGVSIALVIGALVWISPGYSTTADREDGRGSDVGVLGLRSLQVAGAPVLRVAADGGMTLVGSLDDQRDGVVEQRTGVSFENLEEKLAERRRERDDATLLFIRVEPEAEKEIVTRAMDVATRVGFLAQAVDWGTNSRVQTEMPFRFPVEMSGPGKVEIVILNSTGRVTGRVRKLVDGEWGPGSYEFTWDGKLEDGSDAMEGEYQARERIEFSHQVHMRGHKLILKESELGKRVERVGVRIDAQGRMIVGGVEMGLADLERLLKRVEHEELELVVSGNLEHEQLIEQIRDVAKESGVQIRMLHFQAAPGASLKGVRQGAKSGTPGGSGKALVVRISEGGRLYALSDERTLEEFREILQQQDPETEIVFSVHSEREKPVVGQVYKVVREEGFKLRNMIFDDAPKRITVKVDRDRRLWIGQSEVAFAALKDTLEALQMILEKKTLLVIRVEARGAEFDLLPERVEQVRAVARDVGIETQAVRFGQMEGLIRGEPYALDYEVPERTQVKIALRDIQGNTVRSFRDEVMEPGQYGVQWDGKDEEGEEVESGIYFYTVEVGIYHKVYKVLR